MSPGDIVKCTNWAPLWKSVGTGAGNIVVGDIAIIVAAKIESGLYDKLFLLTSRGILGWCVNVSIIVPV